MPPLPLIGRLGPRMAVSSDLLTTLGDEKISSSVPLEVLLERYFTSFGGCANLFYKKVPISFLRKNSVRFHHEEVPYLSNLSRAMQFRYLRKSVWPQMSPVFYQRLYRAVSAGRLTTIESWFNTAEAMCLPFFLLGVDSHTEYSCVDHITRWSLANCANGYASFIKTIKTFKKCLRKHLFSGEPIDTFRHGSSRTCSPYLKWAKVVLGSIPEQQTALRAQAVALLTQTRASGLADHRMMMQSITKFKSVVTTPYEHIQMDEPVLSRMIHPRMRRCVLNNAKLGTGPSAIRGFPRSSGGQNLALAKTCTMTIDYTYDLRSLSVTSTENRRISNSRDVLDYCISQALNNRQKVTEVTLSVVNEPSKARTITVGDYALVQLLNVAAHIFKDVCCTQPVRSGMRADRHLFNFVWKDLHPQNTLWDDMGWSYETKGMPIHALSSDLETATDYANPSVGRQIWDCLISGLEIQYPESSPRALLELCRDLHVGPRTVYYQKIFFCTKLRGWLMGDPMTKVILTLAQEYVLFRSNAGRGPTGRLVGSIVGDDLVILSRLRHHLGWYLDDLRSLDFRVSDDDTFISSDFMFYCEETSRVPQGPGQSVVARTKYSHGTSCGYIDTPRIRLLIPTRPDEDRFSNTNLGRFSLLGKEYQWCLGNNSDLAPLFRRAIGYQNCLVPQDADTQCPFMPVEAGGNGSYTTDTAFWSKLVLRRSKDPRTTHFRVNQLLSNEYAYRWIRSDRPLRGLAHRYSVVRQVFEDETRFPEGSVVKAEHEEERMILRSFKQFLSPETAFMKLEQARWFNGLFDGRGVIPPNMQYDREILLPSVGQSGPETLDPPVIRRFLERWRNPGFTYRDDYRFLVRRDFLPNEDPLFIEVDPNEPDKLSASVVPDDLIGKTFEEAVNKILTADLYLDDNLWSRLPLLIESDSMVMARWRELLRRDTYVETLVLISTDRKLLLRMIDLFTVMRPDGYIVEAILMHPALFLTGWTGYMDYDQYNGIPGRVVIQDPGSIFHQDLYLPQRRSWWEGTVMLEPFRTQEREGVTTIYHGYMEVRPELDRKPLPRSNASRIWRHRE
ncbi:RdRp [Wilkie narna-like virus 2]|uniref:RdRp n=1 Tax=Wilkie narna-like virus 2 TaxID=2010281 RepID=UPI000B4FBFDE|nr:RdRp [Wilkie narna-like virus 2]ASA47454.1 RdRp [Wilkie narna-like virus 2]